MLLRVLYQGERSDQSAAGSLARPPTHDRDDILREREREVLASCTFQPQCGSR